MAKILLLATFDTKLSGHAYTRAQKYKEVGHEVCFVSLYRKEEAPVNSIFDKRKSIRKFIYGWFNFLLLKLILSPKDNIHCFCSTYLVGVSAKTILNKCPFKPDYIYINWVPDFLSAKTVSDLYRMTGAKMIISMIDQAILSLCHYHCDCEQFLTGCRKCQAVSCKWIPRYVMSQRKKYWCDIPMIIIGANDDIRLAQKMAYLKNKTFYPSVANPTIPFVTTKKEARKSLNLRSDDFIIFAGAHYLYEKRKGFDLLLEALNIFSDRNYLKQRRITLLIIGIGSKDFASKVHGINVVAKDFIKGDDFYNAYYACDIYASPTLADSGPMMVPFAFACGRPVVSFPVGYALDLVVTKETGYMAKYGDVIDFSKGLEQFYDLKEDEMDTYENNCKMKLLDCANKSKYFTIPKASSDIRE